MAGFDGYDLFTAGPGVLGGTITQAKDDVPGMGWYAIGTDSEGNTLALNETAPG